MKTFKKFIKEASGFPTGPVGENPKNLAGEVTDTLGSDVFNEKNLKRINAIIGSIANMEYLIPEHAVERLRGSLDKIHLTFPQVPEMNEQSGEFDLPLTLFGGRFGKTGTEAPDEITNDDGISHMVEGGFVMIRKNDESMRFVNQWFDLCIEDNYKYLNDDLHEDQFSDFLDH